MKPERSRLLSRAIRLAVPLVAILVLVRVVDFESAFRLLAGMGPLRVAAVMIMFGAGQVLSCLRWRLMLGQIASSSISVATLLRFYLIGMFVNLGLPTMAGGDVVRAELTLRYTGVRGDAYASILADRLIGLLAVILLAVVTTVITSGLFGEDVRRLVFVIVLVFAVILAALFPTLIRLGRRAQGGPFDRFFHALLLIVRKPGFLALSLAIAVIVQALSVVVPIVLLADALKIDVPLAVHFVLVPVILLVTQVPLAPGGLGVRETAFVLLYAQVGVPAEAALSLGLSWSVVLIAFGLSGGVALLLSDEFRGGNRPRQPPTRGL